VGERRGGEEERGWRRKRNGGRGRERMNEWERRRKRGEEEEGEGLLATGAPLTWQGHIRRIMVMKKRGHKESGCEGSR